MGQNLKTINVTKLINSQFDHSNIQNVTKHKKSKRERKKKLKVTKHENSNCDKT